MFITSRQANNNKVLLIALSMIAAFHGSPKKLRTIALSATMTTQAMMKMIRNLNIDSGEFDILRQVQYFMCITKTYLLSFFINNMQVAVSIFFFFNS